jgi:aminoglycoside phosphotransferase (APT) family kinase protein
MVLVQRAQLSAIIDFGCLGVGDLACDVIVMWNLICAQTRNVFSATLPIDEAARTCCFGWETVLHTCLRRL